MIQKKNKSINRLAKIEFRLPLADINNRICPRVLEIDLQKSKNFPLNFFYVSITQHHSQQSAVFLAKSEGTLKSSPDYISCLTQLHVRGSADNFNLNGLDRDGEYFLSRHRDHYRGRFVIDRF